jgi:hypothetical protein
LSPRGIGLAAVAARIWSAERLRLLEQGEQQLVLTVELQ